MIFLGPPRTQSPAVSRHSVFRIFNQLLGKIKQYRSVASANKTAGTCKNLTDGGFDLVDLLFQDITFSSWNRYEGGKTLGTKGSEQGIITVDMESINGARMTLEKSSNIAPYAITFGIYGLMFHTHFCDDKGQAISYIKHTISLIDEVFVHYSIPEDHRGTSWNEEHDRLMRKLTE